jgi:subtilisin family serine protease
MASPHVAGIVALMLDKNGCLTPSSIKSKLISTANEDIKTGTVPNNAWGYGKVDAVGAINSVTEASCAPDNPGDDDGGGGDDDDDDSDSSTKISCSLIKSPNGTNVMAGDLFVAFLGLFGLVMIMYGTASYKKSRSK